MEMSSSMKEEMKKFCHWKYRLIVHLAKFLLANGYKVHGCDNNYYDVKLKERRNEQVR